MINHEARGKPLDKRADIWAFGCVLYEMLTAKRAFEDEDVSMTLSKVLQREPDFDVLPAAVPNHVRQTLRLCLRKTLKERVPDIGAVRLALDGAFETGASQSALAAAPRHPVWRRPVPLALASSLLVGLVVWFATRPALQPPAPITRLPIPLAAGERFTGTGRAIVALSPSGRHVAYAANDGLVLRALDQLQGLPIPGTNGARNPFFSPDGQQVAFQADGQLKRVSISGGAPVALGEADNPWGASWGADDRILFSQGAQGIWRVPGTGGTPEQVIPVENGESAHGPRLLPGGEWVLFTLRRVGASWDQAQIVMQSLATDEQIVLIEGGRDARYLPTGYLLYGLNGVLLAAPFDLATRQVTGGAVPMVEGVVDAGLVTGAVQFAVAATGSLVYVPGAGGAGLSLTWVDREGQEEAISAEPQAYRRLRVSPDGTRLAVEIADPSNRDIWIWHVARETWTRLTFDAGFDRNPIWTPDGARVVFASDRDGGGLFWKAADGTGGVERLLEHPFASPYAWTADGRLIFDTERGPGQGDIAVLTVEGDRTVEPLLNTGFNEVRPALSPDGRWLAYRSTESGREEIYVRPFPNIGDGKWQVSPDGGASPVWSPDGQALFYREGTSSLMAVPVDTEPSFTYDAPERLFNGSGYASFPQGQDYDISSDGQRFVFSRPAQPASTQTGEDGGPPQLILVQNWTEELRRLVPVN